jgi:hypothetical protein
MKLKNRKVFYLGIGLTAAVLLAACVFFYFKNYRPQSLQQFLSSYGAPGQEALKSFDQMSDVVPTKTKDGFEVTDDNKVGLGIQYANQKEQDQNQPQNQTKIDFPSSYQKPIVVDLGQGKTISITDKNADSMSANLIEKTILKQPPKTLMFRFRIRRQKKIQALWNINRPTKGKP